MTDSTLLIVDGHSLAFRSYYAFAKGREGGLRTSTGIPTSVAFGFLRTLLDVMKTEQPNHLAIAFDLAEPTFRHQADESYKAGRVETPEEFIPDIENLQELLGALNIPILTRSGYEADDVIGTVAQRVHEQGWKVKILSGDRDLFQLIDVKGEIQVLYLSSSFSKNNLAQAIGPEQVKEKLGVWPHQVVDYKALCGDPSDNIPGVRGIGPKTAVQLLEQYESLENIYDHLGELKKATRQKLENGKTAADHSKFLAQIVCDISLEIDPEALRLSPFNWTELDPLLHKLEFRAMRQSLHQLDQDLGGEAQEEEGDTWFFAAADTPPASPVRVRIIDSDQKLADLVKMLETCRDGENPVAWDTETTALTPQDAELVGLGCCWGAEPDQVAYIPLGHHQGENLDTPKTLETLRPILEGDRYPKVFQNAKFDRLILRFQGIQLAGVVFDTMLASYVLNPESSHNLTDISQKYLAIAAQSYKSVVEKGQSLADLDVTTVANYCGLDVYTTFLLVAKLKTDLRLAPVLVDLLLNVELPLEPVLADMEARGIRIDRDYLHHLSQELEQRLEAIATESYDLAGEVFNLNSPKQLSELLFNKLGLDTQKTRKTKLGYSTDAATLEKLEQDHPIIPLITTHRTLVKLKSTYVDALPSLVRPDTERVHTDFNQAITATGRLSSSNPNLQNIPIRTEFSRQIRKAFIPEPGWILVAADYSQIELRILAHLSQEPRLLQAYHHNQDVHRLTAQLLLEKDDITSEERRLAKIINFGVIYGMGSQRFAREAGVSLGEAKTFIQRFYNRYPQVFSYLQRMEKQAVSQGYVETILGRRRYFSFESRDLVKLKGASPGAIAEVDLSKLKMSQYERGLLRAAANAPIQGSSADIIKVAMVKLAKILAADRNPEGNAKPYQARMLLQVHDELVLEMPPDEWPQLEPIITTTMIQAIPLSVPLQVEIHRGENWMDTN